MNIGERVRRLRRLKMLSQGDIEKRTTAVLHSRRKWYNGPKHQDARKAGPSP